MGISSKTWVNNVAPTCDADDLNGMNLEPNNAIQDSGQTLSYTDREQLSKALSAMASGGDFYTGGGAANIYTLTAITPRLGIAVLQDGMKFKFKVSATNTGASTLNVNGIGAKDIKNYLKLDISAGSLTENDYIEVMYNLSSDYFIVLINYTKSFNNIGDVRIATSNDIKFNEAVCDGSAISRSTYAALFSKLSTTWGIGDGSTTFNIPDLRSAALRGVGTPTIFTSNDAVTLAQTIDDKGQGHWHQVDINGSGGGLARNTVVANDRTATNSSQVGYTAAAPTPDATHGTPRVGNETTGKAIGVYFFVRLF